MAKKKKITAKRQKELKRIKQFIRRAEKRGYKFTEEFKGSLTGRTTRSLQGLTSRKLYELAKYEVLPGAFIPGLQGRYREREAAAKKAVETRMRRAAERKRLEFPEESAPEESAPPISDLIYQNVQETIDEYPSSEGAQYLSNLLNSEVKNYGRDAVVRGCEAAGESLIKLAQEIVYYELNSQQLHEALQAFSQIIRGGIALTKDESKEFNNVSESISDES